ncbi:hypothetical protein LshimejAT787_0107800 [Lyophyllum shimeji]|uniref:Uncharacterized protein n=1 Tax=Lyophyllum shimeji TaxID=47721 RepID=A0A9P3UJZ2_LYOSH|nr:hypothetical protein LshimejAT787_0107800 [Lyophyllum shimeji]
MKVILGNRGVCSGVAKALGIRWPRAAAAPRVDRGNGTRNRPAGLSRAVRDTSFSSRGQDYRNETTEADDLGPHALRKRTLKSQRKKGAVSKANPQLYHGARGRYHYFECLQLMLRKQIATLVDLWGLPQEFEVVCRDIWAVHLELLLDPPTAEPDRYTQEVGDEGVGKGVEGSGNAEGKDDGVGDEKQSDENSDEGENTTSDGEEDPELAALLRANSDLEESSSEDEPFDHDKDKPLKGKHKSRPRGAGRRRGRHVYESPASTIAVLIVACWTMRIPTLCRDFTELTESYKLPYLDPVARQLLPGSMVVHLTKQNIQALSPYHAPSAQALHGLASRLSRKMYTSYGIVTPEANAGPILWRVISQGLGGTPMLYRLTKRLGQILSLPLTLHHTLAPGLKKRKSYDPERHIYDNVAPEVSLIAAAIVVLKMVYGLDGRTRRPRDPADVACGLARVDEFLATLGRLKEEDERMTRSGLFDSRTDVCTGDLGPEMMDEYLAFSERVLIGGKNGDAVLERFFPVSRRESHGDKTETKAARPLRATLAEDEESFEGLRPGEGYRIYRAGDVEGTMAEEYGAVVGRAARWSGVGEAYLCGVVETYERRLVRWWERERRSRDG